ncbi:MAG: EcsC family protein [Thermoleophilaceae bacterium]|nr:EcsC family protein [Thermoleophilaceae bacterium]
MSASVSQLDHLDRPPQSLWDRILAEPDRAPEYIALAAAERFGPAAAEWARAEGAGRKPEKLAKTAVRKHVRLARLEGAALGAGGIITAAPDLVSLVWIQSRMVFYVAAALGHDPRDPMRPAELLVLYDLYESRDDARAALDGVGKRLAQAAAEKALRGSDRTALHLRLAKYLAKRLSRHYAGRLIPLIGAPIAAVQNGGATKALGRTALDYYARP